MKLAGISSGLYSESLWLYLIKVNKFFASSSLIAYLQILYFVLIRLFSYLITIWFELYNKCPPGGKTEHEDYESELLDLISVLSLFLVFWCFRD